MGERMRKLGIIGGMGPESTAEYYLRITQGVSARLGGAFFPDMTIESRSCYEVVRMIDEGRLDDLVEYLLDAVRVLHGAGCEVAAIGCNTGHIVFDQVQAASPIPLVSIVDATRDAVLAQGSRRPMLLGTWATMKQPFFKSALAKAGLAVLTPGDDAARWLSDVIYNELQDGTVRDKTVRAFGQLVASGVEHGADSVILGCTELPMLAEGLELSVPVVDTLQVHVDALVAAVLSEA